MKLLPVYLLLALTIPLTAKSEEKKPVLIIPVEINAVPFSCEKEYLDSITTIVGIYFEQLDDKYPNTFKLAPTIKITSGRYTSQTIKPAIIEAYRQCSRILSFEKYDKNVGFIFSGNEIWPHEDNLTGMGVKYFAVSEIFQGKPIETGIICHEYCHILGLKDLYDTDEDKSGGVSKGVWGSLSIMDKGERNDEMKTPSGLSAIEMNCLGLGVCDTLKEGYYSLEPLIKSKRYLLLPSDRQGEFFLMENRVRESWDEYIGGKGLVIYHIDRSSNKAGYSSYYDKVLTASQRWEYNEINCRPDYPCAYVLSAKPDPSCVSDIFWGSGQTLSSESLPELRFRSGKGAELALRNITIQEDSTISFEVIKPIRQIETLCFQNSILVKWEIDEDISREVKSCQISIKSEEFEKEIDVQKNKESNFINTKIDGLQDNTLYEIKILIKTSEADFSLESKLKTLVVDERNTIPFIYMPSNHKNTFPLQVFNSQKAEKIIWTFDGRVITPDENGYFTATRNGTLRAELIFEDGSSDIICKEIILR